MNHYKGTGGMHPNAATLQQLHDLPDDALLTTGEAAALLNVSPDLLRARRWQRRGPAFEGRGHFVRYRKRALDAFLSGHAGRVTAA
jgi:hypothetical protein